MALTERQQQVKDLLEKGNTAPQIAQKLGISTNAVYQQIRRMRGGKKAKKAGRKSGAKARTASTPSPVSTPGAGFSASVIKPITPQRAVANRRDEIQAEVKESAKTLAEAEKVAARAKEDHVKLSAKHKDELKRLDAADRALRGGRPVVRPVKKRAAKAKAAPKASTTGSTGNSTTP